VKAKFQSLHHIGIGYTSFPDIRYCDNHRLTMTSVIPCHTSRCYSTFDSLSAPDSSGSPVFVRVVGQDRWLNPSHFAPGACCSDACIAKAGRCRLGD